jgi:alkanesulfonate monooxygenase SsuD/methylene tetrahydromethanopterin reductase-like flavin-dependent oxidoreductase (luciferase family)
MTTTPRPTLSVGLANFGATYAPGEWKQFIDLARAAEDAGIDRIVVVDHVVMGPHTENYVWGKFPVPPDAPWLERLTVLASVAAVTTRLRLAADIASAPDAMVRLRQHFDSAG